MVQAFRTGKTTEALCFLFDVLPTLGTLCRVTAPGTSEGVEFSGVLRDPAKPARHQLAFAYKSVQRAFCDERWKLIRYPLVDRTQLFDLRADPHEIVNLTNKPEYAAKVAELTSQLQTEMIRNGDGALLTVPNPRPAEWTPPKRPKMDMRKDSAHQVPLLQSLFEQLMQKTSVTDRPWGGCRVHTSDAKWNRKRRLFSFFPC